MPYLLSHFPSSLSFLPHFQKNLYDDDLDLRDVGWTLLKWNGDDVAQSDVWAPLGPGKRDVEDLGLFQRV